MRHTICSIPGDGIGPEVFRAAIRVIEAAGAAIDWISLPAGAAAAEQHGDVLPRQTLEAIFSGQQGGPMGAVSGVISTWLPAQTAPITVDWGDTTTASVGDFGRLTSNLLKNEAGQVATIIGAAATGALQLERLDPAPPAESSWADPEMRRWEGGSAFRAPFNWSA